MIIIIILNPPITTGAHAIVQSCPEASYSEEMEMITKKKSKVFLSQIASGVFTNEMVFGKTVYYRIFFLTRF